MRKVRTSVAPAGALCVMPLRMRELGGSRNSVIAASPGLCVGPHLVRARLRWNGLHLARHGVQMHRSIVEADLARPFHPYQRMLQPILVIAAGKVLACLGTAALGTVF